MALTKAINSTCSLMNVEKYAEIEKFIQLDFEYQKHNDVPSKLESHSTLPSEIMCVTTAPCHMMHDRSYSTCVIHLTSSGA